MKNTFFLSAGALLSLLIFLACQSPVKTEANATSSAQTVSIVETDPGVKVGDKAPAFNLKATDGKTYSFKDIKDANGEAPKGFVLVFTCNTCPYAVMYEDRLIELHNQLSPRGYPVVAIQPNDPELKEGDNFENMQKRAAEKGFPFLYLMDEGQQIYPQYGASRTPEVYLIDAEGIVRYHGAIDDNAQEAEAVTVNYVINAVNAIHHGQQPDPADVKAIGCTIKTKKS